MDDKANRPTKKSWNDIHEEYTCCDVKDIRIPHRKVDIRNLNELKTVYKNNVRYLRDTQTHALTLRIEISGVEFGRNVETIFGGSDDVRTMIFPTVVRTVRQGSFCKAASLRSVILNDGLEILGADEPKPDVSTFFGVF